METEKELAKKWFKLGFNDCISYYTTNDFDEDGVIEYPQDIDERFEGWFINMKAMELDREEKIKRFEVRIKPS